MIGRVKTLLGLAAREDDVAPDPQNELRLAAACILVEASLIDGHVDQRETSALTA
ncbi:MAG: hypothetical protein HOK83_18385, partial [Rhodospirillaceae bacterium]|nr:hypothetical protein [Rhodospirillaceae bacterium]